MEREYPKIYRQHDLRGKYIRTYYSHKGLEADGYDARQVERCCRHHIRQAGGYVWSYKYDPPDRNWMATPRTAGSRPVCQIDKESGKVLKTHPSVNAAARAIQGRAQGIDKVLYGEKKTYFGFKWRFVNATTSKQRRGNRGKENTGGEKC